jgi:endo-1,4-beta-xylanase
LTTAEFTRRTMLMSAIAATACSAAPSESDRQRIAATPPLRGATRIPIGCAAISESLADPAFAERFSTQFAQLTPAYEMKMGTMIAGDGSYNFSNVDRLAEQAQKLGLMFHAHTLVWYKAEPPYFSRLSRSGDPFAEAYRHFIQTVVARYAKVARGWDVVNEPVSPDGEGLRTCVWSDNLGADDYIARAFEHAAAAGPEGLLFINEYDLETRPAKRLTFMRLVERLLKRGVPIGGIGTQTHIDIDLPAGAMKAAVRDLGSFGLPVHISELDISFGRARLDLRGEPAKLELQARQARAVVDAFAELPERQRYGLTLWGMIDKETYLRKPPFNRIDDKPLAFDDNGQPKAMAAALYERLRATAPAA